MNRSSLSLVGIIWRKELVETLRDRKTIVMMIVLPLLLYPLIFLALGQATAMQVEALRTTTMKVGAAPSVPVALREAIDKEEFTSLVVVEDVAELRSQVGEGQLQAGLLVSDGDPAGILEAGETLELRIVFDGGSDVSRQAEQRLRKSIEAFESAELDARLKRMGKPRSYVEPVAVKADNVAPPARQGGYFLGQILPMLISVLMIGATFYPAIDLTAGEKERGTLQTLLTAPITPMVIVGGKYMAVVTLAIITGLMNLVSMAFVALAIPLPAEVSDQVSLSFGIDVFFLVLLALVMLGMMFGALMMAIAVTAKSFKEAQNYLTPLYLVCIFPLLISGLPGVQLTEVSASIPIVNLALAIKSLLVDGAASPLLGIVFVSTACWIALALALAARVFRNEAVLLGDAGISALFARRGGRFATRPPVPTVGEMVVLLGLTLLAMFYGTLLLQGAPLLAIIHATQWGFLLLPALILVAVLKLDFKATFKLRWPPAWALAAGLLAGLGTWVGAQLIVQALFETDVLPVPNPAMEEFSRQLAELARSPDTAVLLFAGVALAPAICEEALFRGVVQGALSRRMTARAAIVIQAALFGIYHLNVYQAIPAFAVGLLMGWLAHRSRSLLPGVVLHALHNGLALAAQFYVFEAPEAGSVEAAAEPTFPMALLGLLLGPVIAIALLSVRRDSPHSPVDPAEAS